MNLSFSNVVFALLLLANGVLLFQNFTLRSELKKLSSVEIEEGNTIPDFSAIDLRGNVVSLVSGSRTGDHKRILFYFHPACGYCKTQMPYWVDLVSKVNHATYDVVALTTEDNVRSIQGYLDAYSANSWNVWIITPDDAKKAELSATPITVVLGNGGVVDRVWVGMWHSKEILEVEKYFGISLAPAKPSGRNNDRDIVDANISRSDLNNFNLDTGNSKVNTNNFNAR